MIGAGTVINPLIKIVSTVAILAAVGVFIVEPILDTTENTVRQAGAQFRESQRQAQQASREAELAGVRSRTSSYVSSLSASWPAAAREVRACARAAGDELAEAQRCDRFAQRLVHGVQSDRSFALSYADSLEAQGNAAGAARITDCVKAAGFESAPMHRCRNLADELLFG